MIRVMTERIGALVAVGLAATGCIPVTESYLRPSAPGAEYHQTICGGSTGPHDQAVVQGPKGVMLAVEARAGKDDSLVVVLNVYVPRSPDLSVQLASATFAITDPTGTRVTATATAVLHQRDTGASQPPFSEIVRGDVGDPFGAETTKVWHGPPRKWFGRELEYPPHLILVKFTRIPASDLHLEIPSLLVSGERFDPPAFEIRPASEWYVAPLNC